MATPLITYSVADQIYSFLLASRYVSPFVYPVEYAEQQDYDVWETLQNNLNTLSELQHRRQSIVRPLRCVPRKSAVGRRIAPGVADAAKRKAAVVGEMLSYVDDFDMSRSVLADSFILGRRYAEIQYQETWLSLDGTPPMLWYVPVKLVDADRRRFRWAPVWTQGPEPVKVRTDLEMFDTNKRAWVRVEGDYRRRLIEDVWAQTEDRIGYSRGALQALFFADYFQTGTHKKIVEILDRYALIIAKLDSVRSASSDLDNATLVTKTKDALNQHRSGNVFVLQDGDSVETLDAPGQSSDLALEYVRYWDGQVARFLNGSLRTSGHSGGEGSTGARAQAETESETSEAFYQLPREHHAAVLTRDLVGSICHFNQAQFAALGLADAPDPVLESQQVKRQNAIERLQVIESATKMVAVREADVYEAAELPPPDDDEPTVGGPGSAFDPAVEVQAQLQKRLAHDRPGMKMAEKETSEESEGESQFAADIPRSRWQKDRWKLVHRCGTDCEHERCATCRGITKKGKFTLTEARAESENFPGPVHPNCDCEWVRIPMEEGKFQAPSPPAQPITVNVTPPSS